MKKLTARVRSNICFWRICLCSRRLRC